MEKIYIMITAGGSGLRMGSDLPKQFLMLNGEPILFRTIRFFACLPVASQILVVLPPLYIDYWNELRAQHQFEVPCTVVSGGLTRFHSVKNALEHIPQQSLVMVHDGVRPLLDQEMVLRCIELTKTHQAVVPVLEISESMRKMEENGSIPVDRSQYRLVQTPQVFHADILIEAYNQSYLPSFTDDATVVERMGVPLFLTQGDVRNIKITTPQDLAMAELLTPPLIHWSVFDPDLALDGLVEGD